MYCPAAAAHSASVGLPSAPPATDNSCSGAYRLPPSSGPVGSAVPHAAALGEPREERVVEDLQRWSVMLRAGYAWAGSTFHQGGVAVLSAAEDTERLRSIFVQHFGPARRTILHGQSYGGGVASKAAELYAAVDGRPGPYDGVLLTSGTLYFHPAANFHGQVSFNYAAVDAQGASSAIPAQATITVFDCGSIRQISRTPASKYSWHLERSSASESLLLWISTTSSGTVIR